MIPKSAHDYAIEKDIAAVHKAVQDAGEDKLLLRTFLRPVRYFARKAGRWANVFQNLPENQLVRQVDRELSQEDWME